MGKALEKSGKTVQDAITAALDEMRLTIDDVHIDVLDEGKPGLFGLLSGRLARVRVSELEADERASQPDYTSASAQPGYSVENSQSADSVATAEQAEAPGGDAGAEQVDGGDATELSSGQAGGQAGNAGDIGPEIERAVAFLGDLLRGVHVSADITAEPTDEGFALNVESDDSGILIGHRGETLDAFQYLLNIYMNRGREDFLRVTVDIENYKLKREAALKRLAERMADKVVRLRRNFTLDAMNSYERRVIHSALQNHPRVETYSVGEDPNRKVVVTLKSGRSGYTPRSSQHRP